MLFRYIVSALCVLALLLGGYNWYSIRNSSKIIATVDMLELFNDFEMKKELEVKLNDYKISQKQVLDSLYTIYKTETGRKLKDTLYLAELENEIITKEDFYKSKEQEVTASYDQQIWIQLKQYSKEYAEKNNIEIVIGDANHSSLLYSSNTKDITKDLSEFINTRYLGRN